MEFTIEEYRIADAGEILPLYQAVGWTSDTDRPEMLARAFRGSLLVLAARSGEELLGLIRVVGDGASILYIQDLLVYPEHQGKGVGTALVKAIQERYSHVYQKCLVTEHSEQYVEFYQKLGFRAVGDLGCCALMKHY